MTYNAFKCKHNDDGYCQINSYIEIDENGECSDFNVIEKECEENDVD